MQPNDGRTWRLDGRHIEWAVLATMYVARYGRDRHTRARSRAYRDGLREFWLRAQQCRFVGVCLAAYAAHLRRKGDADADNCDKVAAAIEAAVSGQKSVD